MKLLRKGTSGAGTLLLCLAMSGCLHRQQVPPLSAQTKTPDLYIPPPAETNLPPMQAGPPANVADAKPAVAEEVKPRKKSSKRQTQPVTPVVAPVAPPPEAPPTQIATLGALAPAGSADPKQQQELAGKIAAVDKRINDLPITTLDREQKQITKVRQFLKEASDALRGGDVEGAGILATKAELLLDDLTK